MVKKSQSGLSRAGNEQINGDIIESTQKEPEFTENVLKLKTNLQERIIALQNKTVIFYCRESMICCADP